MRERERKRMSWKSALTKNLQELRYHPQSMALMQPHNLQDVSSFPNACGFRHDFLSSNEHRAYCVCHLKLCFLYTGCNSVRKVPVVKEPGDPLVSDLLDFPSYFYHPMLLNFNTPLFNFNATLGAQLLFGQVLRSMRWTTRWIPPGQMGFSRQFQLG